MGVSEFVEVRDQSLKLSYRLHLLIQEGALDKVLKLKLQFTAMQNL